MPRTGCLGSRTTPSPGPGGRLLRQDRGPSRSTSGGRESGCSTCAPRGGGGVSAIDAAQPDGGQGRSEEHTSELQSLMRLSYAVFCLKKQKKNINKNTNTHEQ